MWTKLDHLRKGLSILVFGALAVILLPVILLIGNDFVQILLICLLVAHFVIAVLYFYRGIAVAVMCALYVYLSGIAVAMQTVLTISNIVPVSAVSDLLNAAGVVFFLTFTMVIPVPRKARDFIRKRLQASVGKDDESNPDETMRLTDQRVKGTSYNTFITFRGGAQWDNLPYSWAMAEPRMRKLRIAVSIVLAVLCVVGLFVASVFESDTALIDDALPLGDWTFWVGLSSVISLIAAGFVMLAGIVRGLLAGIAAEAFLVGVLWGYDMLRRVRQTSQMMFIAVVALSVLLAVSAFGSA